MITMKKILALSVLAMAIVACTPEEDPTTPSQSQASIVAKWDLDYISDIYMLNGDTIQNDREDMIGQGNALEFKSNGDVDIYDGGSVPESSGTYYQSGNQVIIDADSTTIIFEVRTLTSTHLDLASDTTIYQGQDTIRFTSLLEFSK